MLYAIFVNPIRYREFIISFYYFDGVLRVKYVIISKYLQYSPLINLLIFFLQFDG